MFMYGNQPIYVAYTVIHHTSWFASSITSDVWWSRFSWKLPQI